MRENTFLLTEFPAPCNFKCKYCYIKSNDPRRKTKNKIVTSEDFLNLSNKIPSKKTLFWFCSIGETTLYNNFIPIIKGVSKVNAVMINTNLSTNICDKLLSCNTENIGLIWSMHWDEIKRLNLLNKLINRYKKLTSNKITIFPELVATPSHIKDIKIILDVAKELKTQIYIVHYRNFNVSRLKNGLVIPEEKTMKMLKNNKYINWNKWEHAFKRWEVKGGYCSSGVSFVVINSHWKIVSSGCSGYYTFGNFPEKIGEFKERGICDASECPCTPPLFNGMNNKFQIKLSDVYKTNSGKLKDFMGD